MNQNKNPGTAGTKREILRSAECVYCGFMVAAPGETIPPALDVTARKTLRCGHPGASAPRCWTKGGRTVSLVAGRLQYTASCQHDGHTFPTATTREFHQSTCTRCGALRY